MQKKRMGGEESIRKISLTKGCFKLNSISNEIRTFASLAAKNKANQCNHTKYLAKASEIKTIFSSLQITKK